METCCTRFTAAEGGARLAAAVSERNILAVEYSNFIATRLVYEDAYKIRGLMSKGRQRSVYLTTSSAVSGVAYELQIMTDLKVAQAEAVDGEDWSAKLDDHEVFVCTSEVLKWILSERVLTMDKINVLIVDNCHLIFSDDNLKYIMNIYKQCDERSRPRILALTYPLFASTKKVISHTEDAKEKENAEVEIEKSEFGVYKNTDDFDMYEKLEWSIEELERELCCEMDLAEDIDGGKRMSGGLAKPNELIIEYNTRPSAEGDLGPFEELSLYMRNAVNDAMEFIGEHRYDPTEIYGEDLYEEFKNIPDPTLEPKFVFKQFLYVLDELGPYAADKAAFSLLAKLEKLKIKVPYERHFLLLCLCTTVFVRIRCHADEVFSAYPTDWEKIKTFCTPKVLRFAEILMRFQPPELARSTSENTAKMLSDIEKCDFKSLADNIQDKVNAFEGNLRDIHEYVSTDVTSDEIAHSDMNKVTLDGIKPDNNRDKVSKNNIYKDGSDVTIDKDANNLVKALNSIYFSDVVKENMNEEIKAINTDVSELKASDVQINVVEDAIIIREVDLKDNSDVKIKTVSADAKKIDLKANVASPSDVKADKNSTSDVKNIREVSNSDGKDGHRSYGFSRRSGGRNRGRGRSQRGNVSRVQHMQQNPDALCGIVFMKEALMAKIMFMLVVDLSRAHPALSYLCAQYCAVETPADPATESKEAQRQAKKQEEVLKKFRMHECNLLLTTSALEEGIDLPRCNLVLRWDVPQSYRSYGLCRSRARATRAACATLVSPEDHSRLLHNLAVYKEIDQIISRKCGCGIQDEPPIDEEDHADTFSLIIKPYTPQEIEEVKQISGDKNREKKEGESPAYHREIKELEEKLCKTKINVNVKNSVVENSVASLENGLEILNIGNIEKDEINENGVVSQINGDSEKSVDSKSNCKFRGANTEICDNSELDITSIDNDTKEKFNTKFSDANTVLNSNSSAANIKNAKTELNGTKDNIICNRCNSVKVSSSVDCSCAVGVRGTDRCKVDRTERDKKNADGIASVDLSTAIALINRYCGKLPSDAFTRLAPQWWMEAVDLPTSCGAQKAYICTLRLPLNCPVKYNIVGHPMPTRVLARRMVALQACRILHKSGELDNHLMPIGKENFKAAELEGQQCGAELADDMDGRPGTTKRRQYYYKRTASVFTDCQPIVDTSDSEILSPNEANKDVKTEPARKDGRRNMLYAIVTSLWCALPERYNTRGRRLHAPQAASQAVGLLMARDRPTRLQIPAFPVYTRSGEVRVSVEHVPDADVRMSPRRERLVRRFMRFVFASVLRVRRRGMRLQPESSNTNNYYVVPTVKTTKEDGTTKIDIDWAFLELIYQHTEDKKLSEVEKPFFWQQDDDDEEIVVEKTAVRVPPAQVEKERDRDGKPKRMENPLLAPGETFVFDPEKYKEAVVTPWYRNQDQPQFFLVAEICWSLTPESAFPSSSHASFVQYYGSKYGVSVTQPAQPLLDVDHTSARLNLLTPRYVNRKGVALPVSSERTRRAKRDRLDQKQILVPELCRVHPFAAPLWFATVALPCVLYRINALLIADEIRRAVAIDVGLGIPKIDEETCPGFKWPPLDFGWSLAEVLNADEKPDKKKDDGDCSKKEEKDKEIKDTVDRIEDIDGVEPKEKTLNDILAEKEETESGFEIGTWSNEMASTIQEDSEFDEFMEPLPSNLTFCTSASGGTNWCDPIEKPKSQFNPSRTFSMAESDCSYMSSDFDTEDSDINSESDDDTDPGGFWTKGSMGVRIEYKGAHEAEAVDVRPPRVVKAPAPELPVRRLIDYAPATSPPKECIEKFRESVNHHEKDILNNGSLVKSDRPIVDILPETRDHKPQTTHRPHTEIMAELFPYGGDALKTTPTGQITIDSIERNKRILLDRLKQSLPIDKVKQLNCFSMVDVDIDSPGYVNEKVANVGFDSMESYMEKISRWDAKDFRPYYEEGRSSGSGFDFDYQPVLEGHPGPSPSVILQALTMSNANDGINLERLETVGDSFLKFAITAYLYCAHPAVHEGKLSHMRSKQVSNLNLYRLGRGKRLGARMIASKFEPHDNWLPPCHRPPETNGQRGGDVGEGEEAADKGDTNDSSGCFIPYNLITQHSIPDKSIADCVEALIGAYLLECGPRGALVFMSWLGIRVLPRHELPLPDRHPYVVNADRDKKQPTQSSEQSAPSDSDSADDEEDREKVEKDLEEWGWAARAVGSLRPHRADGRWYQTVYGELKAPPSPLLRYIEDPEGELEQMLSGYEALECTLQYRFKDRSLLLQALTHASHQRNRLTDCYQRLEFLGDAILDYLITRHLYEDERRHSPGALTDLRSALVNNTIFATLAARHGFHKYFRHMSPGLNEVLTKYVKIQEENGHSISEEHYLIQEDEMEQAEDVEVPKALGDLFESVAGAIFLDSGMSLGAVWASYVRLMGAELEAFSAAAPKSPVRELLEAEPDTAKFGKPERLADGRRVRVCVEVFGRGAFKGVGRNYRIAKGTAARCALRHLRASRAR